MGPWKQTIGRRRFFFGSNTSQIDTPGQIATVLSRVYRFAAHTEEPYSVAQHSTLMAEAVLEDPVFSRETALQALCHDAHEAYIGDQTSPWQRAVSLAGGGDALRTINNTAQVSVLTGLGCPFELQNGWVMLHSIVHSLDLAMLARERDDLMGGAAYPWDLPEEAEQLALTLPRIVPMTSREAAFAWLTMYKVLR